MKWTRVFFILVLFSLPAYSLNLSFLIGTAAQHFTKQDRQMFDATLSATLDKGANGKVVEWKNPTTQNGGYFLPLRTSTINGATCRYVRMVNFSPSERIPDKYTFLFCKGKKGWVVSG